MPTKKTVLTLLFALIILLEAWVSGIFLLYFASLSIIITLLLSYLFLLFLLFNLQISRKIAETASEGDTIAIEIKIYKKINLFDHHIEIRDNLPLSLPLKQTKMLSVLNFQTKIYTFSYQAICSRRGVYSLGPVNVKFFDPLSFFFVQKKYQVYSKLIVYPQIFYIKRLSQTLGNFAPRFGSQTTRISGNYEEFYGIREYQKEDGWRKIHWRSSARLLRLMVKHFEISSQWRTMLFLDTNADKMLVGKGTNNAFEYAVRIAASLFKYLMFKKAFFGLISANKNLSDQYINRGEKHFSKIINELTTVEADSDQSIYSCLNEKQHLIPDTSSVIIITCDLSKHLIGILQSLKLHRNIAAIPIILNADSFCTPAKNIDNTTGIKNAFNKLSCHPYIINYQDNLCAHFMKER